MIPASSSSSSSNCNSGATPPPRPSSPSIETPTPNITITLRVNGRPFTACKINQMINFATEAAAQRFFHEMDAVVTSLADAARGGHMALVPFVPSPRAKNTREEEKEQPSQSSECPPSYKCGEPEYLLDDGTYYLTESWDREDTAPPLKSGTHVDHPQFTHDEKRCYRIYHFRLTE